tara:strand:+ start:1597 stop:1878 length:282 start_codon:yes stop_codon:yes gene_type:complete
MVNVFENMDIRKVIFYYIYPNKIKPGMVMMYRGSKNPKRYMNPYIGKLFKFKKYVSIDLYPYLKVKGVILSDGIDTEDTLFFPDEDDLKIVLV